MSVINQMLKDLEQRSPEQGQAAVPMAINQKPSTIKIVLISLTVLICLNLLGFYIWDLQERAAANEPVIKQQNADKELHATSKQSIDNISTNRQEPIQTKAVNSKPDVVLNNALTKKDTNNEKVELVAPVIEKTPEKQVITEPEIQKVKAQQISVAKTVTPKAQPLEVVPAVTITPTKSKMLVSRRQLSSKELVAQKLVQAEKSIKVNDITKAEQLFEEVLIINPNHKQARKKLAALWFGRKSYQPATNLLSQGISLDRNDAELRLLKARIHLQQGQHRAAFDSLKPLPNLKQQEYQVMLANVAQQIEQYESAIQAYKVLIDMQAYSGRWHLGLAIVYDKNSQFSLAAAEYALALTKSDLSIASAEFAQQRMHALGE